MPRLLPRLLRECPYEPATALFRAYEIEHVARHGLPHGRGLDLGCGTGTLTSVLVDEVGSRTLVGVEPDALEAALAADSGVYERVHAVGGADIPERDGSFDFVFSNSVLEHICELDAVLREVARVLKPGGSFVFTVPADTFHRCMHGPLVPWTSRRTYLTDLDARLVHLRYPSEAQWAAYLGRAGLDMKSCSRYLSIEQTRRWETLSRFTGGLAYHLSRKRARPIEVQRKLHLRSAWRLPAWAASLESRLLTAGLRDAKDPRPSGGMMIVAHRPL